MAKAARRTPVALARTPAALDAVNTPSPETVSESMGQATAGVGETSADTFTDTEAAAAKQADGEVATQMPETQAAEPPAAGTAPVATLSIDPVPQELVVIVRGPAKGRWRAGRFFTPEPVTIPLDDLNDEEKGALIGDPELTVTTTTA